MSIRTLRERILQTLAFEVGGIAIAAPVYGFLFGRTAADSFGLIAILSLALLVWVPIHNTIFDLVEWRFARRLASDRPHGLRILQAASLEASSTLVTLPLVMIVGSHGIWEALAIDLGLTAFYVVYGYIFHLVFDRLRPVLPDPNEEAL